MAGTSSISGLISGLDTTSIISQLMDIAKQPVASLQTRQAVLTTKLTAWQDANTRILALKMKADALAQTSTFQTKNVASSDTDLVTGTASNDAIAGTYYITVNKIAKAQQQISSSGYADTSTTTLGTGTISIKVGSGDTKSILIDQSSNTLAGIAKTINDLDAGVSASIINDGSSTSPYRLVITSNTVGTAGQATVTTNLTGGPGVGFTDLQSAQDASLTLGSGSGAIQITKPSNDVSDVIPGVDLNLLGADNNQTVTLTVTQDTAAASTAIHDFVDQYNNLISFINSQFAYDSDQQKAGTLFADPSLQGIQSDLMQKLTTPVNGFGQTIKVLGQVGVTMNQDNTLSVDDGQLSSALNDSVAGVMQLFSTVGTTTNASVSYVASTDRTMTSGANGYAVSITRAATQAWVKAGVRQTENLASDETLTINGASIHLTAGMSQSDVVTALNSASTRTGVTASTNDGYLVLTRTNYGSASSISVTSNVSNGGGTPAAGTSGIGKTTVTLTDLGGEAGTGTGAAGVDVAGTMNGEAATGSGQFLSGNSGNATTDGLKIKVEASSTGNYSAVHFTKGIGSQISDYAAFATSPGTGPASSAQDSLKTQIQDISTEITDMNAKLADKENQLNTQFAAMESALSKLKSQGDYLTSQIDQLSKNWKSSSSS